MNLQLSSLVQVDNRQPVTNSRIVAKAFHKTHHNVMQKIKRIIKTLNQVRHVRGVNFNDPSKMYMKSTIFKDNQYFPIYIMTFDGFSDLVMGFTGKKALIYRTRFIHAFHVVVNKLNNVTYTNHLLSIATNTDPTLDKDTLDKFWNRIHAYKSKAIKYDAYINDDYDYYTVSTLAEIDYNKSAKWLNNTLAKLGIQYKDNNTWHINSKYETKGYAYYRTCHNKFGQRFNYLVWTHKGRIFIINQLHRNGVESLEYQANQSLPEISNDNQDTINHLIKLAHNFGLRNNINSKQVHDAYCNALIHGVNDYFTNLNISVNDIHSKYGLTHADLHFAINSEYVIKFFNKAYNCNIKVGTRRTLNNNQVELNH